MNHVPKVAFYTLGCKLNFSETSTIARSFSEVGYDKVAFSETADVYVINTCSVTDNADKKCRHIVRSALRQNDQAFIIVVGCYAQLKPDEIAAIDGVDLVLGATEKFKVTDYINDLTKKNLGEVHSCEISEADFYVAAYSAGDRTRGFLKVQDGCDYKCTYCTIPLARGISRSAKLDDVVSSAYKIADEGRVEVVLTGVNIGDYGKGEFGNKKHEHTFLELVSALDQVKPIHRFRISSIEPNLLRNELIDFVASSERFVPHFHIPLQSGSDSLLKVMKRRYLRGLYAERVDRIRMKMPHACIGVDVIVGFPGETEELFLESYNFLNNLNINYLHVFTYSERPNTEAATMEGAIPLKVRHKRSKMLRVLSAKKRRQFYESQLGGTFEVLFEGENKEGYIHGFTQNYVKVKTHWDPSLVNKTAYVKLIDIDDDGLVRFDKLPQPELHPL